MTDQRNVIDVKRVLSQKFVDTERSERESSRGKGTEAVSEVRLVITKITR